MIYLDNAATTAMDDSVFRVMLPWLRGEYGNPNSKHSFGQRVMAAIDSARERVAELINAQPDQIIFTSSGSEANNMVLQQAMQAKCAHYTKHCIVTTEIEHESLLPLRANAVLPCAHPVRPVIKTNESGFVDSGCMQTIYENKSDAKIVSIMHTNNETGMMNDLSGIGKFCHDNDLLFHTDCVQAAGSAKIDVKELNCDFLSLSGHKIHGPKGVGALFFKDKTHVLPLICGGESQEFGLRGGTQNVAAIVGMGFACRMAKVDLERNISTEKHLISLLITCLLDEMHKLHLGDIIKLNSSLDRIVKTVNVRFDGVDAETLVMLLDERGVCVSAGSACHNLESTPSRVLTSIGLSSDEARSSIRLSVSHTNTDEEMKQAAVIIAECVKILYNKS